MVQAGDEMDRTRAGVRWEQWTGKSEIRPWNDLEAEPPRLLTLWSSGEERIL